MLKNHEKSNHQYFIAIYALIAILTVWKLSATLITTAQIIRYRTLASAVDHKKAKLDSSLAELETQIAKKKSVAEVLNSAESDQYQPVEVYSSLTQTTAVANLLP